MLSQLLTVQHPLEESRDCLAFATEPVFASLGNIMGDHSNLPRYIMYFEHYSGYWQPVSCILPCSKLLYDTCSLVPDSLRGYTLYDVEIKYGLLQLAEVGH